MATSGENWFFRLIINKHEIHPNRVHLEPWLAFKPFELPFENNSSLVTGTWLQNNDNTNQIIPYSHLSIKAVTKCPQSNLFDCLEGQLSACKSNFESTNVKIFAVPKFSIARMFLRKLTLCVAFRVNKELKKKTKENL